MSMRKFDRGAKFGKLLVISRESQTAECLCDCGNTVIVQTSNLLRGVTKSCGCLKQSKIHRQTKSITYTTWCCIKNRCGSNDHPNYIDVTICAEWKNSFPQFLTDMGERPTKLHTIDRIDNSKGYFPGNCRWATKAEQGLNQRSNVRLQYKGETLTLSEWARKTGIKIGTLWGRLYKSGWSIEKALNKKTRSSFNPPN